MISTSRNFFEIKKLSHYLLVKLISGELINKVSLTIKQKLKF